MSASAALLTATTPQLGLSFTLRLWPSRDFTVTDWSSTLSTTPRTRDGVWAIATEASSANSRARTAAIRSMSTPRSGGMRVVLTRGEPGGQEGPLGAVVGEREGPAILGRGVR